MTQPTAMYGMDAFLAMETDEAMKGFIAYLDGLQPEIRARMEAKLRARYRPIDGPYVQAHQNRQFGGSRLALEQRRPATGLALGNVLGIAGL